MRAGRLIAIVLLMQNNGKMTSKALAEKLEVSERTIIRDMESLSEAGVPVYAERGLHGGWMLAEGYRTELTGMHIDELISVIITSSSALLGDLGQSQQYEAAVQKLLAAAPDAVSRGVALVRQKIHIDGAGWHQMEVLQPFLPLVQEAVWEERLLRIRYRREDGITERIIRPLGLVAKQNIWYVIGEADGERKTYRISKLLGAELQEERFERPEGFDLAVYWEQSTLEFKSGLPKYPAVLELKDASVLTRFTKERYVTIIETLASSERAGWLIAHVEFQSEQSACEIVLSYGSHIQVTEPAELRERATAELKAAIALYLM
ncbi:helix-turn-helix transcriptional regulator [Paenibacillus sinopodophylli]|uniref:helix-turn-helix transcriptional regulator n=1 Tax=Paenibacillus sinopodophylli TaxID=1837342 RepID=UPI00110CE5D1|nr:YafY family protein [Paenibacillus sinopodophylli]